MAGDYVNIGNILADKKNHKAKAIESYSKGLEILRELAEKRGRHDPMIGTIEGYISELQGAKE